MLTLVGVRYVHTASTFDSSRGCGVRVGQAMLTVRCVILTGMTPCNVQKCPNAANEAIEPLLIVGPLCDDHRARLLAGEDYELQGSEESVSGTTQPTVLLDDSLRSLDQYVLLVPPHQMVDGNSPGHLVPLRVHRRGEPNEREINLVIPHDMLREFAAFFTHVAGLGS